MTDIRASNKALLEQVAQLREKLAEAEELLQAIRTGSVDALVVSGPPGDRIYTLKGANYTYRVLIETMTEGAVILSDDGTIFYCNSRFAEMVQTPIENVIGGSMIDFVEDFEKDRFAGILKKASAEDIRDELRIRPRGGDAMPVLLSIRSLSTGEMMSICMVVTDLTAQKGAQEEIEESRNRYEALANSIADTFFALDSGLRYTYWNRAVEMLTGISSEEALGKSMYDLFPQIKGTEIEKIYLDVLETKISRSFVTDHRIGQDRLTFEISAYPSGQGGLSVIARDITERRHKEEVLRKNAAELKQRASQLARLSSELTLAEQRERRRLAAILHDHLQQLLVMAKLSLETLAWRIPPKHRIPAEQITQLLKESLDVSRSLTVELCPPILYEGGLIRALEWLSRWMKEKHGFHVDFDGDPEAVPEREGMMVLLFEAVRELLFNVVKHAGVGSARVKMTRESGEYLKIVVSDRGAGFDSSTLWENTDLNSSGFGLFSIRERLSLLGGRFEVVSAPGEGTAVSLTAPLVKAKTADLKPEKASISEPIDFFAPLTARKARKKFRVLLVDDHAVMRQGLSAMLGLQSDIEVLGEASDGEEAIRLARKLRPDVILMDISMPKMNGIEATEIIHSEFPDIRIIGLSMYDRNGQAEAMIRAGASEYRSKGDNADLLLAAIRGEGKNSS